MSYTTDFGKTTGSYKFAPFGAIIGFSNKADYKVSSDSSDARSVIQQAINDIYTQGGGVLWFEDGTYTLEVDSDGDYQSIIPKSSASAPLTLRAINKDSVTIKQTASTTAPVFKTTALISYFEMFGFIIDDNSPASDSSATFTGLQNSTIEGCTFKNGYSFNLFIQHDPTEVTALTGTMTFTKGSNEVAGSGTAFTTEISVGDIIKTAGSKFSEVLSITSNTALILSHPFTSTTETGVSASVLDSPNSDNRILYCRFEDSKTNDNFGFGLLNRSEIIGCYSSNAAETDTSDGGYGFGADTCYDLKIIGCDGINNNVAGIGIETCHRTTVSNSNFNFNAEGIKVLAGCTFVELDTVHANNNTVSHGINLTSFVTTRIGNSEITLTNVQANGNTGHGIRLGGVVNCVINGGTANNNDQGSTGSSGIAFATDNSIDCDNVEIYGVISSDTQTTPTQNYGININSTATDVVIYGGQRSGNTAAGLLDSSGLATIFDDNSTIIGQDSTPLTLINSGTHGSAGEYKQVLSFKTGTISIGRHVYFSNGTPEGNIDGAIGELACDYTDTDETWYIKRSGSGNTGWATIMMKNASNVVIGTNVFSDIEIDGALNHDGNTVGFFGVTPTTRPTELTDELTTITHTAPSTPDYAIQDLVDSGVGSAFGFATKDEGNTVLSVIANIQARQNEIESKLVALGLFQDAD